MINENSVCMICDHNLYNKRCGLMYYDLFMKALRMSECDGYEASDDDEDEDDWDDNENDDVIDCPNCGDNAYWNGSEYVCDDCGWCGFPDEN